jgi:hypothetical protein
MRKLPAEIQAEYDMLSERMRISKAIWLAEHGCDRPDWNVTNQEAHSLHLAIIHLIMPYTIAMGPPRPAGPLTLAQKEKAGKTRKQCTQEAVQRALKQVRDGS